MKKKYVAAAVEAPMERERQDETQFTTKIGGKTSLGPSYFLFCKIFIPNYIFDALICRNWQFSPPNHVTSHRYLTQNCFNF